MMAMIAKRQGGGGVAAAKAEPAQEAAAPAAASVAPGAEFDAVLLRYRKMCKLGVPAASVRQRMALDQVDKKAIRQFSVETNLEVESLSDAPASTEPAGKRAKLHWDAMTLDDGAMSASVWAADALGGLSEEEDSEVSSLNKGGRASSRAKSSESPSFFGDEDIDRLTELFSTQEKQSNKGDFSSSKSNSQLANDAGVLTLCGKELANARVLDPQRSQNVSITIAPLARAYDGFEALVCAIARFDAGPPKAAIEQLETLLSAMPTDQEKQSVRKFCEGGLSGASASELALLDATIKADPRKYSLA